MSLVIMTLGSISRVRDFGALGSSLKFCLVQKRSIACFFFSSQSILARRFLATSIRSGSLIFSTGPLTPRSPFSPLSTSRANHTGSDNPETWATTFGCSPGSGSSSSITIVGTAVMLYVLNNVGLMMMFGTGSFGRERLNSFNSLPQVHSFRDATEHNYRIRLA